MIRSQPFTLPVGAGMTVPVLCDYIKYSEGSAGGASSRIRVRTERGGVDIELSPGDWIRLTERTSQIHVSNLDGEATIVGRLVLGVGSVGSERIAGVVEVVNSERNTSMAGQAYSVALAGASLEVGKWSHIQLWNPLGSGKLVIVEALTVTISADGMFGADFNLVALSGLRYASRNKRSSGADGVAESRYEMSEVDLAVPTFKALVAVLKAGAPYVVELRRPMVIDQGAGMILRPSDKDVHISASVEFMEVEP